MPEVASVYLMGKPLNPSIILIPGETVNLDGIPPKELGIAVTGLLSLNLAAGGWLLKKLTSIEKIDLRLTKIETEMKHLRKTVNVAIKGHHVLNDMMTKSVTALVRDMDWVREKLGKLEAKVESLHERKT